MSSLLQDLFRALCPTQTDAVALAPLEEVTHIPVLSSADASTALAPGVTYTADAACDVVAAYFASPTSGSNDASNYATITLSKYPLATGGTVSATVATYATSTAANSISAAVGKAFALTTSQVRLAAGDTLRVSAAKSGTGLSTPAGTVTVRVRRV